MASEMPSFLYLVQQNSRVPFGIFHSESNNYVKFHMSNKSHEEAPGGEQVSLELIFVTMKIRKARNLITCSDCLEKEISVSYIPRLQRRIA